LSYPIAVVPKLACITPGGHWQHHCRFSID
jgi:hypothetical protein